MKQFLYQFHPAERDLSVPENWTDEDEATGARHFVRLQEAAGAGVVILAGRSLDWEGPAVVIFEADSEEEAQRFMESDPFVAEGLFRATLHPFRAAIERGGRIG